MDPYIVKCIGARKLELSLVGEAFVIRILKDGKAIDNVRLTPAEMGALRDATLNLLR